MPDSAVSFGDNFVNLAEFEIGGRPYALDVSQVREIIRHQEVTPLPTSPPLIEGVIEVRGDVIPVVDLGRILRGQPTEVTPRTRIVVLELDGLVLGLCVESATDVLSLDASGLEDPPSLATQAGCEAVRAMVRRANSGPVMVLSPDHLLESVYRSSLPNQGGG